MSKGANEELEEIEANFDAFSVGWRAEQAAVAAALAKEKPYFIRSYQRIVSLHAWRAYILQGQLSEGSLGFFLEAQNDALVSHVLAQQGSWRVALKALRSCLENVMASLYYKDHPVELQLWASGDLRLAFSELHAYFERHPSLRGVDSALTGLDTLKGEFSTLSRAVHGSAQGFRMTKDGKHILLWSAGKDRLGPWSTREGAVIGGLNQLLLVLYREQVAGAAFPGLRKAVALTVSAGLQGKYKDLGISLT